MSRLRYWAFCLLPWTLFLAGCAGTQEPMWKTVEVKVPVAVACAADPGARPVQPDSPEAIRAARNLAARVDLMLAGTIAREDWIKKQASSLDGCRPLWNRG